MVDRFYEKVRADDLLGPIFDDLAKVNWDTHLPHLCDFWQSVLFGERCFRGNPMAVHQRLTQLTPMDWPRFERWLNLFHGTVDDLFFGERALRAKQAAHDMARAIHARINNVADPRFNPANLTPEQRARYAQYRAG